LRNREEGFFDLFLCDPQEDGPTASLTEDTMNAASSLTLGGSSFLPIIPTLARALRRHSETLAQRTVL